MLLEYEKTETVGSECAGHYCAREWERALERVRLRYPSRGAGEDERQGWGHSTTMLEHGRREMSHVKQCHSALEAVGCVGESLRLSEVEFLHRKWRLCVL